MSKDNSTISFDFLGSFWNITSYPTSHALSDGIISGALRRYQAVSIEAVPVVSHPKLDMLRSELWGGRRQEWGILSSRLQAVCLVMWTIHHRSKQALPAHFHESDIQYCPTVTLNF